MDTNPYTSPSPSPDLSVKRPYTRFSLLLDIVAIAGAGYPLMFRAVVELNNLAPPTSIVIGISLLLTLVFSWLVGLVLNAVGAFRLRPVSFIGLLLNVSSVIMMFVPSSTQTM